MAVTIQQVAEACGVSRGTVDRALHNKKGVRPEVAAQIQEAARQMGYISPRVRPAIDDRTVRIGVVLHSAASPFMQILADIFRTHPTEVMLPVETIVRVQENREPKLQLALIDELVESLHVDGLVLAPLASERIRERIDSLTERGIPVVTVNTDIEDSSRLAYVGPDSIASGRAAAALMGLALGGQGMVLPITDQQFGHYADSQRLSGFTAEMAENFPGIHLLPPVSCYLDSELIERTVLRELENNPMLNGIYPSTAVRTGAFRAVQRAGVAGKVHVVVHDLTPDNLDMIRAGVVDFAIGQEVQVQGTLPLRLLYQYLTRRQAPEKRILTTNIEIKFRYNTEIAPSGPD